MKIILKYDKVANIHNNRDLLGYCLCHVCYELFYQKPLSPIYKSCEDGYVIP